MTARPRSPVRRATAGDAAACAAVYAPYVAGTAVTFETEPPDAAEMAGRIATAQRAHEWLVLEHDGQVVGFAYGGAWRARAAYRWTAEVSVYLEPGSGGQGLGRILYEALLARLEELGYRTVVAGYTLPNEASERLHRRLGFEPVGVFRGVGHKLGAWHDVAWVQRPLGEGTTAPHGPAGSGPAQ